MPHKNLKVRKKCRKTGKVGGSALYYYLKEKGFPKDRYQCLCMNCNAAKYYRGICPHQINKKQPTERNSDTWKDQSIGKELVITKNL